ncbi:putative ATP-grasp-modified RiPP [Streptomyces uncialis]|uniref:putative ATP-grasp-modified RiPP n=2 Tax=Streptomyces TaxID=1883 RepID=UPI002E2FFAB3|nr:putative ATP-grasp-modified RiPP [Streptomyces uncialis]
MDAAPTGARPYALGGARFTAASPASASSLGLPAYDPVRQTAAYQDGTPLTTMATSKKTNPDGDIKNPPPHDEGADPGCFE